MQFWKAIIIIGLISANVTGQDLEIPDNLQLIEAADYEKTESLVIESANWLLNTPLSEQREKRRNVNAFMMKWLSGSPTVSIELVNGVVPMERPNCLMVFMSGWAKYSLENDSKDKIKGAIAGVETAITFYKKNKATLGKISAMEKLIKQQKKGKLESYISSKY